MDTQDIIKNRLSQLPEDIQRAIKDGDLASKFDSVAEKNNLKIDQNGNLQTETLLVMLGLESNSDYIDNVQKSLEISRSEAINITKDVNELILSPIRDSLRAIQEVHSELEAQPPENVVTPSPIPTPPTPPTPITLEQAGQFTIEPKPVPSTSNLYRDNGLNREDILKSIEDAQMPKPAEPVQESKVNLVDHLLTTPKVNVQKVEEKQVVVDKKPDQAPKSYAADPYREQI